MWPDGKKRSKPADEEAGRDLVILIDSSVQESLQAAGGPLAPTSGIAAMTHLFGKKRANNQQKANSKSSKNIIVCEIGFLFFSFR